jgi:hypothetical protein
MPDVRPRFIDPPQLFRSPRYTNAMIAAAPVVTLSL